MIPPIWEIPPNGQGMIALMALNMMKGFSFSTKEDLEGIHRHIETLKLAFVDRKNYITDSEFITLKTEELLSEEYAESRRGTFRWSSI